MRVSINIFKECLKDISSHFKTLCEAEVTYNEQGIEPKISRTKNFAEAEITLNAKQYILALPLNEEAHTQVVHASRLVGGLFSSVLSSYELLRDEMSVVDHRGEPHRVDMLLHQLPCTQSLHSFIDYANPKLILKAIDSLEGELQRLGVVHNNLTPHNIVIDKDYRLTPLRYHYMELATPENDGSEEFASLREWVMTIANLGVDTPSQKEEIIDDYLFKEYETVSTPFEGLIAVSDNDGYLYVNCKNEVQIEGRFIWANDFHEGRAEVQTAQGMGLIDKEGKFIIPAIYSIVEYDLQSGLSRVRKGEEWGVFNYDGEQIAPFEAQYIDDEDIELLSI